MYSYMYKYTHSTHTLLNISRIPFSKTQPQFHIQLSIHRHQENPFKTQPNSSLFPPTIPIDTLHLSALFLIKSTSISTEIFGQQLKRKRREIYNAGRNKIDTKQNHFLLAKPEN